MQAPTPEICVKPVLERDDFDDTSEAFWHSVSLLATLLSMMMMSMITMMMMVKVLGDDDGHDDGDDGDGDGAEDTDVSTAAIVERLQLCRTEVRNLH